jgi:hypothetical protein
MTTRRPSEARASGSPGEFGLEVDAPRRADYLHRLAAGALNPHEVDALEAAPEGDRSPTGARRAVAYHGMSPELGLAWDCRFMHLADAATTGRSLEGPNGPISAERTSTVAPTLVTLWFRSTRNRPPVDNRQVEI